MLKKIKLNSSFKFAVGISIFVLIVTAFLFFNIQPTHADANSMLWNNQADDFKVTSGLGSADPRVVVARIIQIALGFLGIIFVCLIIYAGFLWTTSAGDDDKIRQAKKIITNAIIGLVIILSSFAIVTFILNRLLLASGSQHGTSPTASAGAGLGAIGGCIINSVYPEPDQKEVPRNTSFVVTFKEEINPATICNDINSNGKCDPGEKILPESVRIYKTNIGDGCLSSPACTGNELDVEVATNDNKTFVFVPTNYIGSPSEYIWYSIHLSNDIKKATGQGAFSACRSDYFEWQFEVSNKIDLIPPQVVKGNLFPPADNLKDTISGTAAVNATGKIVVNAQPKYYSAPTLGTVSPQGPSPSASAVIDPNNKQSGTLTVVIASDGITAQLLNGSTMLGSTQIKSGKAVFDNILTLSISGTYSAGNSWAINGVQAVVNPDTLTIGNIAYTFVSGTAAANQITSNSNNNTTAANIAAALSSHPEINATVSGNSVNLSAKTAGIVGNNILVATSNTSAVTLTAMSGGKDSQTNITVKDKSDKPRNAVIQVNFNEAVNPITVSGKAKDVAGQIRVVNAALGAKADGVSCVNDNECLSYKCTSGVCENSYLSGKFMASNVYRTVEFVSDNQCGVNGCGQKIYCLPADSQLRVEINAATLEACANCETKAPFTSCVSGHCYDNTTNTAHPKAFLPLDGVIDMALNSLDGDRSGDAEGPLAYYDENTSSGGGDNFDWSFFISNILDLTPPVINATVPAHTNMGVNLFDPITASFSKVMMSSSLGTGSIKVNNGKKDIEHKLINLWNQANQANGYWIKSENVDNPPADSEPDWTKVGIYHSVLYDSASYRAQFGSGVNDIYQNCYNPSSGVTCTGGPSCCGLTPTAAGSCP